MERNRIIIEVNSVELDKVYASSHYTVEQLLKAGVHMILTLVKS